MACDRKFKNNHLHYIIFYILLRFVVDFFVHIYILFYIFLVTSWLLNSDTSICIVCRWYIYIYMCIYYNLSSTWFAALWKSWIILDIPQCIALNARFNMASLLVKRSIGNQQRVWGLVLARVQHWLQTWIIYVTHLRHNKYILSN